jgi:hypothetical protein
MDLRGRIGRLEGKLGGQGEWHWRKARILIHSEGAPNPLWRRVYGPPRGGGISIPSWDTRYAKPPDFDDREPLLWGPGDPRFYSPENWDGPPPGPGCWPFADGDDGDDGGEDEALDPG